jgi:hypothetical protein
MTPSQAELLQMVRDRAGDRCEYCAMHQALQGATFHLEHIVPVSSGGPTTLENLAWACPGCNLTKSNRLTVPDPDSDAFVPLFNPRTDVWSHHLAWDGYRLVGLTVVGRALIAAFGLNHPRRLLIREAEQHFGLFPP